MEPRANVPRSGQAARPLHLAGRVECLGSGALYVAPTRKSDVARLDLPLTQLARRWLLRGVFGRDTRRSAEKALDAAEQLDLGRVLETRRPGD